MNKTWWKESVVYQIYPRSFMDSNGDGIGDLRGIISKLDYLLDLGVDVIWICPVYKSPNADNGYDISDYYDIMNEFGTMRDWEELLEQVHNRGMKLIMDLVPNHTSDEHPWFIESRSSKQNPKRDWYIWRPGKDGKEPNNWESIFSGSAWELDEATSEYYMHLFAVKQPDLNWENPEVRQHLYEMIRWWLDKGIDGFRVDAITHIKKKAGFPNMPNPEGKRYVPSWDGHLNQPGIQDFLRELKDETYGRYDVMTVGETPGVSPEDAMEYVDEKIGKFDMVFQFEHMQLDNGPEGKFDLVPWRLSDLKQVITKWQKGLEGRGWNTSYLENHDQPRSVSRFGDHRQYHKESAKMLATFFMFLQATPYIYQGQEIGMTNVQFKGIEDYRDVEIINHYREGLKDGKEQGEIMKSIWVKGRDNSRTPMQWSDEPSAGFTTGNPWIQVNPNYLSINVEQAKADPNSILNYYKLLIQLRKQNEVLIYGNYNILLEHHEQLYAYTRTLGEEQWMVLLNFSNKEIHVDMTEFISTKTLELMIANYEQTSSIDYGNLIMKPYESRVYRLV
ncbi:alpha-glucosidase [Ammoniphilus sp. CFH 90114]|uniref:glycoside hydrolase family 13 protein n=1 Tax=Ammoniphilus sp. CFH 90114 TaxID=2493665 RepID=UPI00100E2CCD|nr:alpha-glucosidase [Ammoniphilus sp. CFH 90114]RXT15359.1 alpha-glucosidase [Ammoniphilus sp. CFH 90114]